MDQPREFWGRSPWIGQMLNSLGGKRQAFVNLDGRIMVVSIRVQLRCETKVKTIAPFDPKKRGSWDERSTKVLGGLREGRSGASAKTSTMRVIGMESELYQFTSQAKSKGDECWLLVAETDLL